MTALDQALRPLAQNLIGQFGKSMIYRHKIAGVYDPVTDSKNEQIEDYPVFGVIECYQEHQLSGLIEQGDLKVTIAAIELPIDPMIQDELIIEEADHRIVNVGKEWSGEQVALYILQVRA